jgi:magnesium-transporting ATPase (P-type)
MGSFQSNLVRAPDAPVVPVEATYLLWVGRPTELRRRTCWHRWDGNQTRSAKQGDLRTAVLIALFSQLRTVPILFHVLVACLMSVPGTGLPSPLFRWIPLLAVIAVSIVPRVFSFRQMAAYGRALDLTSTTRVCASTGALETVLWADVNPGDIVKLNCGERCGADALLLVSSGVDKTAAYIDEVAVTGESCVRCLQSIVADNLPRLPRTEELVVAFEAVIDVPFPAAAGRPRQFTVYKAPSTVPDDVFAAMDHDVLRNISKKVLSTATESSFIGRGGYLRAVDSAWVIVIYTGADVGEERACPDRLSRFAAPLTVARTLANISVAVGVLLFALVAAGVHVAWSEDVVGKDIAWYINPIDARGPDWFTDFRGVKQWGSSVVGLIVQGSSALCIWRDTLAHLLLYFHARRTIRLLLHSARVDANSDASDGRPRVVALEDCVGISNLSSVARLAQVTHVLLDKTGTITTNVMTPTTVHVLDELYPLATPEARQLARRQLRDATRRPRLAQFWVACALANSAVPWHRADQPPGFGHEFESTSPDEVAMVTCAATMGYRLAHRSSRSCDLIVGNGQGEKLRFAVLDSLVFTSERRRMSVILHEPANDDVVVYMKGAPESVLPLLAKDDPANRRYKPKTSAAAAAMAADGQRVYVFAIRRLRREEYNSIMDRGGASEAIERQMLLVGAMGLSDRIASSAITVISGLGATKVATWMVTGDARLTSMTAAKAVGLGTWKVGRVVLTPIFRLLDVGGIAQEHRFAVCLEQLRRTLSSCQKHSRVTKMSSAPLNPIASTTPVSSTPQLSGSGTAARPVLVVIDSFTFDFVAQHKDLEAILAEVFRIARGGIACRFAPHDKKRFTLFVKRYLEEDDATILAVGDGANDAEMLTAAHVGVAVATGECSLIARRAADIVLPHIQQLPGLLAGGDLCGTSERIGSRILALGSAFFTTLRVASATYPGLLSGSCELGASHFLAFEFIGYPLIALVAGLCDFSFHRLQSYSTMVYVAVGIVGGLGMYAISMPLRFHDASPHAGLTMAHTGIATGFICGLLLAGSILALWRSDEVTIASLCSLCVVGVVVGPVATFAISASPGEFVFLGTLSDVGRTWDLYALWLVTVGVTWLGVLRRIDFNGTTLVVSARSRVLSKVAALSAKAAAAVEKSHFLDDPMGDEL